MKSSKIFFLGLILLVSVLACNTTKNMPPAELFGTQWELEYLSGPKIAFEGLYPDKKPVISFNKDAKKVEGNNSCNGYTAPYTINGKSISFGEPGPTTMMYCGEGEKFFLSTMEKVNQFSLDTDGKLNLMIGDVPMMRFKKVSQ
ncbi:MAG: META domain-containing protein [Saprospiraceae bacterium]|nr:META domain-containing protein [Saprospiraceae bacterium]